MGIHCWLQPLFSTFTGHASEINPVAWSCQKQPDLSELLATLQLMCYNSYVGMSSISSPYIVVAMYRKRGVHPKLQAVECTALLQSSMTDLPGAASTPSQAHQNDIIFRVCAGQSNKLHDIACNLWYNHACSSAGQCNDSKHYVVFNQSNQANDTVEQSNKCP